jgi:hypothetical protein
MRGAIPPLPHYAFIAWCLVKKKSRGTTLPFLPFYEYSETFTGERNLGILVRIKYTRYVLFNVCAKVSTFENFSNVRTIPDKRA